MNRTVEIVMSEESRAKLETLCTPFCEAIGYLAMWSYGGRATKVRIVVEDPRQDRDGYMEAYYTCSDGFRDQHVYTIGAIFRDGKWEFHS